MDSDVFEVDLRNVGFISEHDAGRIAVDALIYHAAFGANFHRAFRGLLEIQKRNRELFEDDCNSLVSRGVLANKIQKWMAEEDYRYGLRTQAKFAQSFVEDVSRLGNILAFVASGSPQSIAFAKSDEVGLQAYHTLSKSHQEANYVALRTRNKTANRKLWAKYEQVLAYVYLRYSDTLNVCAAIRHSELNTLPYEFSNILLSNSSRKKIRQKKMKVIKFQ